MALSRCRTHPGQAASSSAALFASNSAGRLGRKASMTGRASWYEMNALAAVDTGRNRSSRCGAASGLTANASASATPSATISGGADLLNCGFLMCIAARGV